MKIVFDILKSIRLLLTIIDLSFETEFDIVSVYASLLLNFFRKKEGTADADS